MSILTYQIDSAHSSAQFSIRHLMISNVKGEFTKVSGTVKYDPENPSLSEQLLWLCICFYFRITGVKTIGIINGLDRVI